MPDRNIKSYLNHHLAASVAWFEALERLEAAEKGTPMAKTLADLRVQATADRRVLEELMGRLKVDERELEKATAWLGEKVLQLMTPLKEQKRGPLNLLLSLEALSLAVEGRRALWLALDAVAQDSATFQGPNYKLLVGRAEEQRQRLETLRLEAAKKALLPAE